MGKRNIRDIILLIIVLLGSAALAAGQERLTNADVIALTKSGLSADVIIAKIKASEDTKFDTSTAALVSLGEAGVPSDVVALMVARTGREKENEADVPEQGTLQDLKGLKTFFVQTNDMKARSRIEKELTKAGLSMSDKIENADFFLVYQEWEEDVQGSNWPNKVGVLNVGIRMPRDRRRNVYSTRKEKFYVFTSEPAQQVAQQFVKDFKKALK